MYFLLISLWYVDNKVAMSPHVLLQITPPSAEAT